MCLISIAPKGVEKYTDHFKNIIHNAMYTNPNGTGFGIFREESGIVYYKKGYNGLPSDSTDKEFEKLWSDIQGCSLKNEDILVVHSRIATVGKVRPTNTHPFLINPYNNVGLSGICGLSGTTKQGVLFHNGSFAGYRDANDEFSDTCHFTQELFTNNPYMYEFLINKPARFAITFKNILGSNKLAILNPEKELILLGDFVKDSLGYIHSHSGFNPNKKSTNYTDRSSKNHYNLYGEEYPPDDPDDSIFGFNQVDTYRPSKQMGYFPNMKNYNRNEIGYSQTVEPENIEVKKFSPIIENPLVIEEEEDSFPKEYREIFEQLPNVSNYHKNLHYIIKTHPLFLNYFLAFPTKNNFFSHDKYAELTLAGSLKEDNVILKNGTTVSKCTINELIKDCIIIPKPEYKIEIFQFLKLIGSSKATSSYTEYISGRLTSASKDQKEIKLKKPVKGVFLKVVVEHYLEFYRPGGYLDQFLKRKTQREEEEAKKQTALVIPDWSAKD